MAKRTPGPWSLQPVGSGHRILGGPKNRILADVHATAARVSEGNGKLMAASPAMLHALQQVKAEAASLSPRTQKDIDIALMLAGADEDAS